MDKAPDAFRTISEVADDLDVPQHVLRFWETRFAQIKPMKRSGGRRYYRPDDVDLLRGIRQLLYGEGYTIRGVQRILREQGIRTVQNVALGGAVPAADTTDAEDEAPESEAFEEAERTDAPALRIEAPVPNPVPKDASHLSGDDARRLEAALRELAECQRLLDDVLKP